MIFFYPKCEPGYKQNLLGKPCQSFMSTGFRDIIHSNIQLNVPFPPNTHLVMEYCCCSKDEHTWIKHTLTPYFDGHLWRKYGQKVIKDAPPGFTISLEISRYTRYFGFIGGVRYFFYRPKLIF